jgi:hypothetical protein
MTTVAPKPGFDWSRVRWDDAEAPQRDDCSYCGALIADDAVPLRMWSKRSDGCVFCDVCAEKWFGLESFDDDSAGDP